MPAPPAGRPSRRSPPDARTETRVKRAGVLRGRCTGRAGSSSTCCPVQVVGRRSPVSPQWGQTGQVGRVRRCRAGGAVDRGPGAVDPLPPRVGAGGVLLPEHVRAWCGACVEAWTEAGAGFRAVRTRVPQRNDAGPAIVADPAVVAATAVPAVVVLPHGVERAAELRGRGGRETGTTGADRRSTRAGRRSRGCGSRRAALSPSGRTWRPACPYASPVAGPVPSAASSAVTSRSRAGSAWSSARRSASDSSVTTRVRAAVLARS